MSGIIDIMEREEGQNTRMEMYFVVCGVCLGNLSGEDEIVAC